MDIKKLNQDLIEFWDSQFSVLEPSEIKEDDVKIESPLEEKLKYLGDQCERILDLGSGSGYALFIAKKLGNKIKYGLGIDTSKNAIDYCNQTVKLSQMTGIEFIQDTHDYLNQLSNYSFDGIVCSNVLDVVPYDTSEEMIQLMDKKLISGGYLLLKLNFYLTEELIQRIKMIPIDERSYTLNGILRGVNLTTEEWIARFSNFDLIEIGEYQRVKGPKDRLILMKKR